MIHELNNLLWLQTPYGPATAKFLINYGPESDLQWVCIQHDGEHVNEIWTWSNWDVRAVDNATLGR
jgi:hypothetical protein